MFFCCRKCADKVGVEIGEVMLIFDREEMPWRLESLGREL